MYSNLYFFHFLGDATLDDVSEAYMRMRMVKSKEEIAVIKQSARAADMAGFAIRDAIKEGMAEYELTQIGVQVGELWANIKAA